MDSGLDLGRLSYRRYDAEVAPHRHDHLQLVMPDRGEMEIEIDGKGGRLTEDVAAIVAPGMRHSQWAAGPNRFLVIDCSGSAADAVAERFEHRPFVAVSPSLRLLLNYIRESTAHQPNGRGSGLLSALVLECIADPPTATPIRLERLRAAIQSSLHRRWAVRDMAREMGMSASAMHSLFRTQVGDTPNGYLATIRLERAKTLIERTGLKLAEIAHIAGYSDQSAMTRAMRRRVGMTPARYRLRFGDFDQNE